MTVNTIQDTFNKVIYIILNPAELYSKKQMISILYPDFLYGFPYNVRSLCLGNLCRPKELYNIKENKF